jgi:hypothetical protein
VIRTDYTKLVVAIVAIAAAVNLAIFGDVDSGAALGLVGTVVGYILGNGKSVATGDRPGTLLTRADVRSRADDTTAKVFTDKGDA